MRYFPPTPKPMRDADVCIQLYIAIAIAIINGCDRKVPSIYSHSAIYGSFRDSLANFIYCAASCVAGDVCSRCHLAKL